MSIRKNGHIIAGTSGGGSGGSTSLSGLDDVNIVNPNNGQTLTYDNISQKWKNTTVNPIPTTDNETINTNTDNELQAVGVIEKNAGSAKYDWVGTLAEYTEQNVKTLHPDWICYITDDTVLTSTTYTKAQVDNLLSEKQSILVSGSNIKTINNTSILGEGNLNIESGLQNTATGTNSLTILGDPTDKLRSTNIGVSSRCYQNDGVAVGHSSTSGSGAVAIGQLASANINNGVAIGNDASVVWNGNIAIGSSAKCTATEAGCIAIGTGAQSKYTHSIAIGTGATTEYGKAGAIQLGYGTNSEAGSLSVGLSANGSTWNNYKLLSSDGKIPHERMGDAIQLVNQLPESPVSGVLYLIPET